VEVPATVGSFDPPIKKKRVMVKNLDGLAPYQEAARDTWPSLRREQLERKNCEKPSHGKESETDHSTAFRKGEMKVYL
jgi:hypothetical protein